LDGKEAALPTSQTVTLEKATRDMAALISNLLELYMHDLSEIFPIDVEPDGRFGYGCLPLYWSEDNQPRCWATKARRRKTRKKL
jgi:hypothetical protein